jgi:hypothetical protein
MIWMVHRHESMDGVCFSSFSAHDDGWSMASCFFQRDRWQWRLRVRMDDTPDTPFLSTTADAPRLVLLPDITQVK